MLLRKYGESNISTLLGNTNSNIDGAENIYLSLPSKLWWGGGSGSACGGFRQWGGGGGGGGSQFNHNCSKNNSKCFEMLQEYYFALFVKRKLHTVSIIKRPT